MFKNQSSYYFAIGAHILIGILIYSRESLSKVYFLAAFSFFLYRIIVVPKDKKTIEVLKACGYFVGAEILLRMTKGTISYEACKYLVILFALIGMFYKGLSGRGYPYFLYLMFLVPSIFVASTTLSYDANFRTNIAFVLSGPICLGIAALFCYGKRVTIKEVGEILLFILLPILSLTAYIYLYTPSIEEVLRNTHSNREASGGWGPNQVSTILGLGVLILTTRVFLNSSTLHMRIFNSVLLALVGYRAIVTFSRGGVIAALATVAVFLLVYFLSVNFKQKSRILIMGIFLAGVFGATWVISSQQTRGYIDLRYANKDHMGRTKGDLTTGRKELFLKELEGFVQQPFLGIGSSRAKDQRIEIEGQGVTSHSEVSRILAEHGILGIIILLILIFKPFELTRYNSTNYFFYSFLCFWFLTINHSSMRIAAPAFIYALALLNVKYASKKRIVHRELSPRKAA